MQRMLRGIARTGPSRRALLLAGAAALAPRAGHAAPVCTPRDLRQRYLDTVTQRLDVPAHEARIYATLAEANFIGHPRPPRAPQYVLVVDSCSEVQAAFLYWRLLGRHWELVGASPASTGCSVQPGHLPTPVGAFPQQAAWATAAPGATRVYDFGLQRAHRPGGGLVPLRLQARAAHGAAGALLGTQRSDGCVLLPPALVAFLDRHALLDGDAGPRGEAGGERVPFAGRYLVVVDSERDERPEWAA